MTYFELVDKASLLELLVTCGLLLAALVQISVMHLTAFGASKKFNISFTQSWVVLLAIGYTALEIPNTTNIVPGNVTKLFKTIVWALLWMFIFAACGWILAAETRLLILIMVSLNISVELFILTPSMTYTIVSHSDKLWRVYNTMMDEYMVRQRKDLETKETT